MRNRMILSIFIVCLAPVLAFAQVGAFTHQVSVGDDGGIGMAEHTNGVYRIEASGSDIWGANDGFYFIYSEFTGSFTATVEAVWLDQVIPSGGPGAGDEWKKMGIMARANDGGYDTPGARHAMVVARNDNQGDVQWRPSAGGDSSNIGLSSVSGFTNVFRLERIGNTFTGLRQSVNGDFQVIGQTTVADMPETLAVGLVVTAHNTAHISAARFSNWSIQEIAMAVQATRTMPQETFTGGQTINNIRIDVEIEAGKSGDLVVTEILPEGWTLTASNPAATQDGRNVVWNIPNASGNVSLTYSVRARDGESEGVLFAGSVEAGGLSFGIGGMVGLDIEGADQAWAPRLNNQVTLDGVISPGEYDGAYVFNFHRENQRAPGVLLAGPSYSREVSNLTVHVFHDADYLYVAMDMVDPVLSFNVNANTWEDDSVELYIDGNHSRSNPKENNMLGFQATVQGDGHRVGGNDAPTAIPHANGGFYSDSGLYWNFGARVKDDESGYIVEYRVEKSMVLDPLNRTIVGFDIGVNDNDGTPGRHGKWAWWHFNVDTGGRVDAWNDERGWGVLELLATSELPGVPDWTVY